ncbi:MAG: long-chain-acyl-CoA synthetase [Alphaproteobacteria bacterium]|nr:long-chain-acyl-CoA synthetase [Alphaproteobacteria bacterium]
MGIFQRAVSEVAYLRGALRTLNRVKPIKSTPNRTMCERMEEVAQRHPDRIALISERETFTYGEYNGRANRYARFAMSEGIGKGETVVLLMPNRPEYLAIWMGIARAGGATALLNTSQTGQALAHSISIVKPRLAIVAVELLEAWQSALPYLENPPKLFIHGEAISGTPRIDSTIMSFSPIALLPEERVQLTLDDKCLYIFTSGTTGFPKAANINHYRVSAMALGFSSVMEIKSRDRLYDCLPMYHSNGGILSTLGVLIRGGLCRYLLNAPPGPYDRAHSIKLICGNGLRPDIWQAFSHRFGINHIREFYGATEGNIALFNFDARPGAVGRIPKWAEKRFVVKVVRFDVENERPMRDEQGHCTPCKPGEIGEIIGEIIDDPNAPANRFEGYADKKADEAKILRNAFREGDAWFRSGDLVTRDSQGYFYFVDRIGDTFRWKGENVSTNEVAETINTHAGVAACAVYGVSIDGHDGKAGMAAIMPSDDAPLHLDDLAKHLDKNLAPHARPVFIRIRREMDMTGTFKLRKTDLMQQGIEMSDPNETLHWFDSNSRKYRPLDSETRMALKEGRLRL